MSDVLHRERLTPTQIEVTDRHRRFAETIRTAAKRVPINDATEILKQQLKDATERAAASDAALRHAKHQLAEQAKIIHDFELKIVGLHAGNVALQKMSGINPTIARIIDVVAEHYGTTRACIISNQRYSVLIPPRHIAVYLASQLTGFSLPAIGRAFNRDHSSMLNARDKIIAALETDPALAETIKTIREKLDEVAQ